MLACGSVRFLASVPACATDTHASSIDCTYQVAWSINPHMVVESVDRAALEQHVALVRTVRDLGARVDTMPFVHGAFDSVFAKDNALYAQRHATHALLAQLRYPERQAEQAVRRRDLLRDGMIIQEHAAFEGGDVLQVPGRCAFLGHGFRSSRSAARAIERFLGLPVVPLELVDPALYHSTPRSRCSPVAPRWSATLRCHRRRGARCEAHVR
ncbi:MAG: hypothetical protein H0T79_15785 [Deltaproteobacteria bacterium]|nr:hypothetical protein [Deltaproteobacteria bacterium]